jgi:acyl-coenzyme A synthetase/AMP-(fatty) acid ligase
MFAEMALRHADRTLVDDGARALSYAEALALGRRLTAGLPRRRSLILLKVGLDCESVAAYLALMADGHVPLLVERTLAEPLVAALAARYRPDAILDPQAETPLTPGGGDAPDLHPDLALLLTTSGSTGSPKLVRLSAAGVAASAVSIATYLELGPDERPLLHLPMSYSYGLSIINSHIASGARLCLTSRTVMEPGYWEDLGRFEATSIAGVPFHYAAIRRLGEARLDVPSLRTLTQAGGRLDPRLVSHFAEWAGRTGRRFIVMYGQTEAGPRIAWLPPELAASAPDAIGQPIPRLELDLVGADGGPVPDGQEGQIRVRGPMVMMGYAMEAADLAAPDTQGGTLLTGDLATRGADGLYRITGRAARILKIYGLRVNLDEVEQRLQGLGLAAACFGADDELRIALEGEADPDAVRQQVVALFSLPPRGIVVRRVGEIPRAPSGKVRLADLGAAWEAPLPARETAA